MKQKQGLGRGLGALIGSAQASGVSADGYKLVDVRKVEPNPNQPRQYFEPQGLDELAESIKQFGIIQPLLVRAVDDQYIIIAGERRFRAARIAKLEQIPVIVKEYSEVDTLQVALIENLQRQDLTPLEEAVCFARLVEDFLFTPAQLAEKLGKTKHSIDTTMGLLQLCSTAQELVAGGYLQPSHAKALLAVDDEHLQAEFAKTIADDGLSVRQAEAFIVQAQAQATEAQKPAEPKSAPAAESRDMAYRQAADELAQVFGSRVHIKPGAKKSRIEIEYHTLEDLERLMDLFRQIKGFA